MTTPQVIRRLIDKLLQLRREHGFRAETLAPDLAFVGLIDDALDSAEAALELLLTSRPYRAYSMARVTFESAQRLLILATAEDYVGLGARAWLYYQQKDLNLVDPDTESSVESVERQVTRLWAERFPQAAEVMRQQRGELERPRGPDNFLGKSLVGPVSEAYAKIASARGTTVPEGTEQINRRAYSALTRDTHACNRLEPQQFRIDADGFVEVTERKRIPEQVEASVLTGLEPVLKEAIAAVEYRLLQRKKANVADLEIKLREHQKALPTGYFPDFGARLVHQGLGHTNMTFMNVPIGEIWQLPDGTLRTSLVTGRKPDAHTVTFDFKGEMRQVLSERLRTADPSNSVDPTTGELRGRIELPEPLLATLTAVLGKHQESKADSFVPLLVVDIRWDNPS